MSLYNKVERMGYVSAAEVEHLKRIWEYVGKLKGVDQSVYALKAGETTYSERMAMREALIAKKLGYC
jgi:hypothetical protein